MSIPSNPTSRAGGYYPAPEKLAALRSKVMGDPEQMAAGRSKVIMGEMLKQGIIGAGLGMSYTHPSSK